MAHSTYKQYFDIDRLVEKIKDYLPSLNEKRFRAAFDFAEVAHRGQIRKDGKTPYIAHPVASVEILASLHADEDTLITALLHDVPEDTKYTLKQIRELFGPKVEFLVDGITKLSKVQYKHDMPARQVESLKKLLLHSAEDLRVIIIKLADRLHNMSTLSNIDNSEKRLRIATETLEIYVPLANLLGIRELKSTLEDMCFKYMFPTEYENLKKKIDSGKVKREKNVKEFIDILKTEANKNKVKIKITQREKNLYSIYKSLCSFGKTINYVDDRIGIVVTADNIADCYHILGIIHLKFTPLTKKFKDYIANPKSNGYKSLHTSVFGVDGILTEVQIRTKQMNIEAEHGMAANFLSENKTNVFSTSVKSSKWLKNAIQISEEDETAGSFLKDLKLDVLQERIVVLTPRGRPVDLPKGASVIDFAYAIHTKLGRYAEKAEVNEKIVPITHRLKTRDVVKVIVSKDVSPDLSWLPFVNTNLAKRKILSYLKKISKPSKIKEGRNLLQTELDILHIGLTRNLNFKKIKKGLLNSIGIKFDKMEDVFVAIGEGNLQTSNVISIFKKQPDCKQKSLKWISIKIVAKNRFGLMKDIYEVLYKYADDMNAFKGWASKASTMAYFNTNIAIRNDRSVSKIFYELRRIDSVLNVYKISRKGLWLSLAIGVLLAAIWVMHPMLIRIAIKSSLGEQYPVLTNYLVHLGLISVFGALLFYVKLVDKFFPIMRNKRELWFTIFALPIVTTIMLAMEVFYFKLSLSWPILFMEMLFIYLYLVLNYTNFTRKRNP